MSSGFCFAGSIFLIQHSYIVESIANHDFLKVCTLIHSGSDNHANHEQGTLLLHVKWKGYDKAEDMTWEPEENLKYV